MAATRSSMSPQLASAASFSAVSPSKNVSYRNGTGFPMWMRSLAVFSSPSSAISFSSYSFSPGRRPMYSMRMSSSGRRPDRRIRFRASVSIFTGSPMSSTKISPPLA